MSIVRSSRPPGNFTTIQNEVFKAGSLSFAAMGFLCYLLSKPDNWSISIPACAKVTQGSRKASGRDAIYALLDELISAGYIDRQDVRDGSGRRSGVRYSVYDVPIGSREKPYYGSREKAEPETAEQETDQPIPDQPFLANPDYLIKTDTKQELKDNNIPPISPKGDAPSFDLVPANPSPESKIDQEFSEFWTAYPRKQGKQAARKAFGKARKAASLRDIATGLNAHIAVWPEASDPRAKYIPHASTWLNEGRWEDEPGHSAAAQGGAIKRTRAEEVRDAWAGVPDIEGV